MKRLVVVVVSFFLIVFVILAISPFLSAEENVDDPNVETSVFVDNSAPVLIKEIPNFTWAVNSDYNDAFNLSLYFVDYNGDELSFNSSLPDNITISIDDETGMVSFSPDAGFSGSNNVTFYAFDGSFITASNVVYLNVGTDHEAPKWFDPSISHVEVSQNDVVSFFTYWTDNVALSNYIFSINHGSGWVNYTSFDFSGAGNNSNYSLQISAAPSSTVYWAFYAADTSGNYNVTSTQEFNVAPLEVPPAAGSGGSGGDSGSGTGSSSAAANLISSILSSVGVDLQDPYDFSLDYNSIDVELFQGESKSIFVLVKNTGKYSLSLNFSLSNINDLAKLNENGFFLDVDESRELMLEFSADKDYPPGQYYGVLQVTGHNRTNNVPIVVTVKHYDPFLNFSLAVPSESKLVNPGKNVTVLVNISQFDYVKDFRGLLYLSVRDFEGNVYNFIEKEILVSQKAAFIESLNVPSDSSEGLYLVYGRVEYENKSVLDSDNFEVGYRFRFSSVLNYSGILLLILLLAFIFAVLMVKYRRGKRRERLLTLYLLLSQLKDRLNADKLNEAAEIYIKLKDVYGEPIPQELLSDKEFLKKELSRLSEAIKKPLAPENASEDKGSSGNESSEDKKEESGKGEESSSEKQTDAPSEKTAGESGEKAPITDSPSENVSESSSQKVNEVTNQKPEKPRLIRKIVKKVIKRHVSTNDVKKDGAKV